jgi:hypothetical protein
MLAPMTIDATQLQAALRKVHPGALSKADAETIVELAQMSVDADGQEDADEIKMFFTVGKAVFALAGLTETPSPSFDADEDMEERVESLCGSLATKEARELAYSVAHVLTVIDVQIAPEEDAFLENLRGALGLGDDRADELAADISAAITPAD